MAPKIKSETISLQHKKTKNFIIVLAGVGLLVVFIGSFLSTYNENAKAFAKTAKAKKKKEETISNAAVDRKEIKESWASSVERRLQENAAIMVKGITAAEASFREDALRREKVSDAKLEEIKGLILSSQNSVEAKIEKVNARVSDVERKSKEQVLRLSTEMRKVQSSPSRNRLQKDKRNIMLPRLKGNKGLPALKNLKDGNVTEDISDSGEAVVKPLSMLPSLRGLKNTVTQKTVKPKPEDLDKLTFFIEEEVNKNIEDAFPLDANVTEVPLLAAQYELGLGFFSAVTLTGAYAPIFGEDSDQASIPVLLEVEGDMIVANGFTESIDKCFAMGGAIGNPSSNTVDIRLTVIECVLADGEHKIRGEIKGWVIGENGKPGLSGDLIHKSGQYISRFILAGLLESLSSAFVTAATPENTANGSTTEVITGGATTGAATGTQNAFSRLADFYIELAEKTLPMIEAKAGRHVSVLVQGGTLYEVTEFNKIDINGLIDTYEQKQRQGK